MTITLPLSIDGHDQHPGQWRLAELQVVNWGTFSGLHRVEVARQGHLITGHSGSGKSSLLDAIATVMTPPKLLRFNAAAQEVSNKAEDRTVATYLRGAWSRQTDEETGEGVSQFLRTGASWSGVLLRFDSGGRRDSVSLIRLFHLRRGSNSTTDLKSLNIIVRGDVGLRDFEDLARNGIETRKIKAAFDGATVTDQHSVFAARFAKVLGIGDGRSTENALQLLHKTQSAKNLGSLDNLFRSFMLERPRTFEMAEVAVEQFGSLAEAHRLVVEARRQADHLRRLQQPAKLYDRASTASAEAAGLLDVLEDYRDRRLLELDRHQLELLRVDVAGAEQDKATSEASADRARHEADIARLRVQQVGGAALDAQVERVRNTAAAHDRVVDAAARQARVLAPMGLRLPQTAQDFAELRGSVAGERERIAASRASAGARADSLHDDRSAASRRIAELRSSLDALRGRRTNIAPHLLRARTQIAEVLRVPEGTFRFAGELIDVAPAHADWTGAIERVLRPLAPTLLIRDELVDDFTAVVDSLHLGVRLVYESVPPRSPAPQRTRSHRSLVNRLRIAPGLDEALASWLAHRLADRFDYDCVDEVSDLRQVDRGVTRAGQVKHSSRRFEKDDRSRIHDRSSWMLGTDNSVKVDDLIAELQRQNEVLAQTNEALAQAAHQQRADEHRLTVLETLVEIPWAEVDVVSARENAEAEQLQLDRLRSGNSELAAAQLAADEASERQTASTEALRAATARLDQLTGHVSATEKQIAALSSHESSWHITDAQAEALEARFRSEARSRDREHVFTSAGRVQTALTAERKAAEDDQNRATREFSALAAEFRRTWPSVTADLTDEIADRRAYAEIHDGIVASGLPAHEGRFFDLLREQSQQLTGQLLNEIRTARREVLARIEPVNASLLRSPFDTDRFLQIKVRDRRTDEVKDFMDDLRRISEGTWQQDDARTAETRFALLQKVMQRLGAEGERAWRSRCLDTRTHVTFVGVEQDPSGAETNRHDSGAGLSGGQRQKLVIFCLAAALRYQLTDSEQLVSDYGTIVLDEAFDKADSEFTKMAMDVFAEFGFHMILATPLKLLQTLERYVGAVSYVSCVDHKASSAKTVMFERTPA